MMAVMAVSANVAMRISDGVKWRFDILILFLCFDFDLTWLLMLALMMVWICEHVVMCLLFHCRCEAKRTPLSTSATSCVHRTSIRKTAISGVSVCSIVLRTCLHATNMIGQHHLAWITSNTFTSPAQHIDQIATPQRPTPTNNSPNIPVPDLISAQHTHNALARLGIVIDFLQN